MHPYIEAYLKKGWFKSMQMRWYWNFHKWIKIVPQNEFHINQYRFFDDNEDEIRMNG